MPRGPDPGGKQGDRRDRRDQMGKPTLAVCVRLCSRVCARSRARSLVCARALLRVRACVRAWDRPQPHGRGPRGSCATRRRPCTAARRRAGAFRRRGAGRWAARASESVAKSVALQNPFRFSRSRNGGMRVRRMQAGVRTCDGGRKARMRLAASSGSSSCRDSRRPTMRAGGASKMARIGT